MATLSDIKRRIGSVNNTRQITSAMKMVSAAKLARAQQRAQKASPYSSALQQLVNAMLQDTESEHPLLKKRQSGKKLLLLFSSDRGLAGGFNNQIIKEAWRFVQAEQASNPDTQWEWITIGRKGEDFLKHRHSNITQSIVQVPFEEKIASCQQLAQHIIAEYSDGQSSGVYVAYNAFVNAVRQDVTIDTLLPISAEPMQDDTSNKQEVLFEPSQEKVLEQLLPDYVSTLIRSALLNTEAGEHAARMVAMEGATKNASEMVQRLVLQYNRLRQAAITKELIEIVNGAEAL